MTANRRVFGIGNDIAPVDRFRKLLQRDERTLLDRMFTPSEGEQLIQFRSEDQRARAIAASFAIKESVYKALGTGLVDGMSWKDVEVSEIFTAPHLYVSGRTKELFGVHRVTHWNTSCSSSADLAIAFTILFSEEKCDAN